MYARVVVPGWGAQPQRICVRCPVMAANVAARKAAVDAAATARAANAADAAARLPPPSAAVEATANRSGSPRSHTSGAENNRDAKSGNIGPATAAAAAAATIATSKNGSSVSLSQSGEDMRGALRELSYGIQLTNRMSYYVADQFLWLGMRGMVSCGERKEILRKSRDPNQYNWQKESA